MKKDSLGDRMKNNYENAYRIFLTRRTPVIIRVDGRAFHTLTRKCRRPFDIDFQNVMTRVGKALMDEAQGGKLAYVQSDEVSVLLTDWDTHQTQPWFGYNLQKITSISAAIATSTFNKEMCTEGAQFDARAFNMPLDEVSNYFLWRAKDWRRNSISMAAHFRFSHQELHGVPTPEMVDMLYHARERWEDLPATCRNGMFITRSGYDNSVRPTYADVDKLVQEVLPNS